MFLHMSVILSTGRVSLYDVTLCLAAWSMFLPGGSVSGTMFLPVEGGSLSWRSPRRDTPWTKYSSCTMKSGRYASYWNVFLSKNEITRLAENRRKREHKRKLMSKYPRKFSRTPPEGQARRSRTSRKVRARYKTPKRRRIFNPNVLFASRSKLRMNRKNAMLGKSSGRKGAWKITPQKDKAETLAEQGRSVHKTGRLAQHRRPVEEKVQRKGNSTVNEEQDKTRQQVQSENRENGKEATTNTRMESPISVRIVQTQVEHPVDGVLEVTAQVKQEISLIQTRRRCLQQESLFCTRYPPPKYHPNL